MTTPAQNVDQRTYGDFTVSNEYIHYTSPGGMLKWRRDQRPESGTCQYLGGFKLARSFEHAGLSLGFPVNSVVAYDKKYKTTTTYKGSIWNQDGFNLSELQELSSLNSRNKALVKCLNKLKDQDFHLGQFLAESKQTINLVRTGVIRIARGVQAFRGKYPGLWPLVRAYQTGRLPRHLWCNIPRKWLELQYGWIPLLSDIYGAVNHLAKRSRFSIPYLTVKSGDRVEDDLSFGCSTYFGGQGPTIHCKRQRDVYVSLTYAMENPVLAEMSALGLINPAEIVWELTRYSFVLDWLIPVGSWLSALTADVGYKFITGAMSSVTRTRVTGSEWEPTHSDPNVTVVSHSNAAPSGEIFNFSRIAYENTPIPGPYIKNPLSVLHVANAIALLAQAFEGRTRR